jgi:NADPH:quinone reductase-like Zn-dependent oxidoreductase
MAKPFPPETMRGWQYSSTKGGLEKHLKLNTLPVPKPKPNQHLIQVLATALNPVDYKPAEIPYVGALIRPKLATPGLDFTGRIVKPADGSSFKAGQLVFGVPGTSPVAGGALKEFIVMSGDSKTMVVLPDGLSPIEGTTVGVAGLTAYQSVATRVKTGDRVFINGGSGGTGTFGIQFAKAAGAHVTTSCSTPNVELCKSLGADEVIDYKKQNVLEALKTIGWKFDHAVDNVGKDKELIWGCVDFLKPGAEYVLVAGEPTLSGLTDMVKRQTLPKFLGGIKGNVVGFWPKPDLEHVSQILTWIKDGKIRAVLDSKFSFEDTPKAFERLKTGRSRGKIVIDVAGETYEKANE